MGNGDSVAVWEEDLTPVCNLITCMHEHWTARSAHHARLMLSLRVPYHTPTRFARSATSSRLLREVKGGLRKLIWSPRGIELYAHIYPFFARRGMDFKARSTTHDYLMKIKATEESWIIVSSRTFKNEDEHRQTTACQSGFFQRLILPSVTQFAYIAAAHTAWHEETPPFASQSESDLVFVRTSTRVTENIMVGFAWVPGKAMYFDVFCTDEESSRLVTPDAFVL